MLTDPHVFEQALRAFPFLQETDDAVREMLYRKSIPLALKAGRFMCVRGHPSSLLPLMLSGTARVYDIGERRREITLYRIEPGESCILTAACILSEQPFPAYAQAETDIEAIGILDVELRPWVHRHEAWRTFVFKLLSHRLGSVLSVINEVAFRRMDARIAGYLVQTTVAEPATIAITHGAIAAELGSSREVVSRILKDFERKGLIGLARKRIALRDIEGLRMIIRQH